MVWRSVARSVIGMRHQTQQIPCQDYGDHHTFQDVVVGAVADGAGSAKYAEVGARVAVEKVLQFLASSEQSLKRKNRLTHAFTEAEAKRVFHKATELAIAALKQQASQDGCQLGDLACTLLVFLATPAWIAAMQIGDGFMLVRLQGKSYQLLLKPDRGECANETTFVTSANALSSLQVRVVSGPQQFICASTDALERVAIKLRDWTPFPPFFQPLEDYLKETAHPEDDDAYLMSFLESDRLNQKTDDDKTLLLCLYERE